MQRETMEMSSKSSSSSRISSELQIPKKWKDRDTSPERTKVWTEPNKPKSDHKKVSVVYYISRNGQLEHPHFMEVPLSSPQGLYLKDVMNRLNTLRGKGMATLYSWSAKRSYKNGFVWHDLTENDFIYPTQGQEYILKGSEILEHSSSIQRPFETASSRSLRPPEDIRKSDDDSDFPVITTTRRRNQSWSSIDLNEYRVYKSESSGDSSGKLAADASTQTEEKRRRRRTGREEKDIQASIHGISDGNDNNHSVELSREEISPPPSDSSPETLENLMNADGRLGLNARRVSKECGDLTGYSYPSGRMKASSVLIQLLSCGSISFKDYENNGGRDQGLCLMGSEKRRVGRGAGNQNSKETGTSIETPDLSGVRLEDKEYFSGSLIETKKFDHPTLKRSSSYNADSGSQLKITEGGDSVRAKCMPRKSKTMTAKKENSGGKRVEVQQSM